jgi:hypothetical protein
MRPGRRLVVALPLVLIAVGAPAAAQTAGDDAAIALAWHKLTGQPLDLQQLAENSEAVRRASNFDRPDALEAEKVRLGQLVSGADPSREFTLQITDRISEYDRATAEFSIGLFQPGYYIPLRVFGQEYQIVFANAEGSRAIPMPKEEARAYDQRLNQIGRTVINEVRFRVVGAGDPAGAVTGDRIIRAELLGARLLDRTGQMVFTPTVVPLGPEVEAAPFDASTVDVAGFRIGGKAGDLEATLTRLFGRPERAKPGNSPYPGIHTVLTVNQMGCDSYIGRRNTGQPGAVCVTAYLDDRDVVRMITIERVFPWVEADVFRRALVRKYGPVATAQGGLGASWSWGPEIPLPPATAGAGGHLMALTGSWAEVDDFERRSGNAIPHIRLTLRLFDAAWAQAQ